MRPLIVILLVALCSSAQEPDWKLIKEMSGEALGVTIETYGAQIARNGDMVKVSVDFRFKDGLPANICSDGGCTIPRGVSPADIREFKGRVALNCATLVVVPEKAAGELILVDGKHHKTKEPPFTIKNGNIFGLYFCEQPSATPTSAPKLRSPSSRGNSSPKSDVASPAKKKTEHPAREP